MPELSSTANETKPIPPLPIRFLVWTAVAWYPILWLFILCAVTIPALNEQDIRPLVSTMITGGACSIVVLFAACFYASHWFRKRSPIIILSWVIMMFSCFTTEGALTNAIINANHSVHEQLVRLREPSIAEVPVSSNNSTAGLWGYIDRTGAFVLQPQWVEAGNFCSSEAKVLKDGTRYYIDRNGKTVPEHKLSACACGDEDRVIKFEKDIFDASGHKLIAAKGKNITVYKFSDGMALFSMPMRMIQRYYPEHFFEYRVMIPMTKEEIEPSKKWGQYGYIDTRGRIIIEPKYYRAESFKNGLAKVPLDTAHGGLQSGFIDKNDQPLTGALFSEVEPFTEGISVVKKLNGMQCLIDRSGRLIADNLQDAKNISNGSIVVKQFFNWFLMDTAGNLLKRLDYDDIEYFHEGLAVVAKGNTKGYIDTAGELVIPLKFMDASRFSKGLAAVQN